MLTDTDPKNILESISGRRVLVIGDLILDRNIAGRVERISPEAPVPIVQLDPAAESLVPGGAANVARNVLSLGGIPLVCGVVGEDRQGAILRELLEGSGMDVACLVTDSERPTTTKTRVTSGTHQLIRLDRESTLPLSGAVAGRLARGLRELLPEVDAVVMEDYNKGVLVPELISGAIGAAREGGVPVAVDPKFLNFFEYSGCTLFKPNRLEAGRALGRHVESAAEAVEAGMELVGRLGADAVLVTMGELGSVLCRPGSAPFHSPTLARHVFDVSGAGDTVIATMAMCMAAGLGLEDSVRTAGFAAAAACAEPGVYAVTPADILRETARYRRGGLD